MKKLNIVFAPDPIFTKAAIEVENISDEILSYLDQMLTILYKYKAIGLGANMVGLLHRIIVVDLQEDGIKNPYKMINPKILQVSQNVVQMQEASISFPGIKAKIARPEEITIRYQDLQGKMKTLSCAGLLSRVIQHELDYLDGKTFLDYVSPLKRKILLNKLQIK